MLKKTVILIALLFPLVLSAQMGKLIGSVVDKETNEPLSAANIWVPDTKIGVASDPNGKFFLPLKPGVYTLNISVLGYKTVVMDSVTIEAWKVTNLDVILEQTVLQGESVILKKDEEEKQD